MGMGKTKCFICKIVGLFVVVGALNWGLVGFFNFNLVETIFGSMTTFTKVIYAVVGIAGLMTFITWFKNCPGCCKKDGATC